MKKTAIIFAAILSLAACNKSETIDPIADHNTLYAQIEQETATKTYMDANNHIRWAEGDQIVGFMKSSLGLKYQILPSSVGKTYASFENISGSNGNINAGTEWNHNVVYYPYSDVVEAQKLGSNYSLSVSLPAEQTYAEGSFGNGSMVMVAVSEDNNITFRNILGGMKLQLKGTQKVASITLEGKNNEKLSGAAVVTAYTDETKPAITMTQSASTSVTLNCGSGVQLNESTATDFIIALPPVLFSQGFTVTVTDSESQTYTVETEKANTVLRSSLLVMPAVTLTASGGGDPEEDDDATYIEYLYLDNTSLTMYPETSYTLVADIYPVEVTYPTLTWSSSDNTVATVDQTGKITTVSDGTATITALAVGGVSATCTVKVKSATSVTVKNYVVDGVDYGKGIKIGQTIWAPINCGYEPATADYKGYPYGKLYQWGRKYGQGYSTSSDATEPEIVEGPVMPSVGKSEDNKNIFYEVTTSPYDWCNVPNDALWNSGTEEAPVKTETDPCPAGWRVPTFNELYSLRENSSAWTTNADDQTGYYFSGDYTYIDGVAQIFLPAAGRRYYRNGLAGNRGSYGRYWSSRPYSNDAYYLYFGNGYVGMDDIARANGFSVRCVQVID